jgi:hypothetical protein
MSRFRLDGVCTKHVVYPSNLTVSSAYSKYVFYIYRDVKDMEKFDAERRHGD